MRTFNQNFSEAKDSAASSPVTLAVFHFGSGDTYVSDRDLDTLDGPVFEGLVTAWGELTYPSSGQYGLRIPEMAIELDGSGAQPFTALLESSVPENTLVDVYQWFHGLSYNDKEPLGRFVVSSPVSYGGDTVRVTLAGAFIKKNRVAGRVITRDDYPDADQDAVGRCENIVYGRVDGLGCHPVSSGAATTLASDIDPVQTAGISLSLSALGLQMPASGTLQAGAERLTYTGISGKTLTGVVRGVSGTTPASHKKGSAIFEVKPGYTYLVAGHPVKSIGDVYVGGVRVVSGVTRLTDDSGKAKLAFSDKFTLEKSVDLDVDEGIHEHAEPVWQGDGSRHATYTYRWTPSAAPGWVMGEHTGKAFKDSAGNYFFIYANGTNYLDVASIHGQTLAGGAYTGTILRTQIEPLYQNVVSEYYNAPYPGTPSSALCDADWNTYCGIGINEASAWIKTQRTAVVSEKGIIVGAKLAVTGNNNNGGSGSFKTKVTSGDFIGQYAVSGSTAGTHTVRTVNTLTNSHATTWTDFQDLHLTAVKPTSTGVSWFFEHWLEVYYIPYGGGASPASGVRITGNSAADIVVGGQVTCDIDGYQDDASGTYTGIPGGLIENPADVIRHFMSVYIDVPLAEFDGSFETARQELSSLIPGGYRFAGAVRSTTDACDRIESMSAQSRVRITHDGFTARVRVLPGSVSATDRVITLSMQKQGGMNVARTGREEVVNRLSVHYMPDLAKDGGRAGDYLALADATALYPADGDPGSVSAYGPRTAARPLTLDFVRDGAMASGIRDYTITMYKDAGRRLRFTCYLDNMDLEPGDVVEVEGPPGAPGISGARYIVEGVGYRPGSLPSGRPDEVRVQAREV